MNVYDFLIAGLKIRLTVPWDLPASARFAPFLTQGLSAADVKITLSPVDELPPLPATGMDQGFSYRAELGDTRLCYHRLAPEEGPFALTRYEKGKITLLIKTGFTDSFSTFAAIFNRIWMEEVLVEHHRFLLHAALCEKEGKAILFIGESGAGKSTQARLWQEHRSFSVLNGDRAVLEQTPDGFLAHGSPWAGSSGIYENRSAAVRLAALPRKAEENSAALCSLSDGFAAVFPHIALGRRDLSTVERAMELCADLVKRVPVAVLNCRPDEGAVKSLEEVLK